MIASPTTAARRPPGICGTGAWPFPLRCGTCFSASKITACLNHVVLSRPTRINIRTWACRRGKNSVYSRVSTDISLLGDDGERYYIHNNNSKGYSKGWIPDADGRRMRAYFGGKPLKSFVEAFAAITAAAEGGKGEMGRAEDEEAAVHEEQAKTEVEETERSRRLRPRTAAPAPHHPARKAATPQVQTRSRARGKAVETRSESAVVEGDAPEPAPLKLEAPPSPAAKAPAEAPSPAVETPVAAEAKRRFRFVVGSAMRLKAAAASAEAGAPAVAAAAEAPPQAEANRARVKAPRKRDAAAAGFCMADVVVGAAAQRSRAMASTIPADGELMNNPANEGEACVIGAVDWVRPEACVNRKEVVFSFQSCG